MPLAATLDDTRIEANRATDEEWVSLKSRYRRGSLTLSCGENAIPKTHRNGTKFFAHRAGLACSGHEGGRESADHLEAKAQIVEAAREAGWKATLEYAGPGRSWIADVMAQNDEHQIALEVQLSSQTSADFARRQQRYEDAGLKCFWFIHKRNERAALEADVPFATFFGNNVGWVEMVPLVPPEKWFFPMLDEAVGYVLRFEYRRKFEPKAASVQLGLERHECPSCRGESICFFVDRLHSRTPCGADIYYYTKGRISLRTYGNQSSPYGPERAVYEEVFSELLARNVGAAAVINGNIGEPLSYSCAHCGHNLPTTATSWRRHNETLVLPAPSALRMNDGLKTARHICKDQGSGKCSQRPVPEEDAAGSFSGESLEPLAMEAARSR